LVLSFFLQKAQKKIGSDQRFESARISGIFFPADDADGFADDAEKNRRESAV